MSDGVEILLPRVPLALYHTGYRAIVLGPIVENIVLVVTLGGRNPEEYYRQKPKKRAHFAFTCTTWVGTFQVHVDIVVWMRGSRRVAGTTIG